MTSRWLNISTSQLSYGMFPSLSVPRSWNLHVRCHHQHRLVQCSGIPGTIEMTSGSPWVAAGSCTLSSRVWMAPNEPAILEYFGWSVQFIQFLPPTILVKWGWLTIGVLLPQIFGSRNCQLRLGSLELATPRSASPPQTTGVPTSEEWGGVLKSWGIPQSSPWLFQY